MKIEKSVTPHFAQYEVYAQVLVDAPQTLWQRLKNEQPTTIVKLKLEGVIEADDQTGLVVQQMFDQQGNLIYTNGVDDIVIDNTAKILLLLPNIRQALLVSGFKPKLSRIYREELIIRYKGPIQPDVIIKQVITEMVETSK